MSQQNLRGQVLLNAGVINEAQLEKALELQKETGHKIGAVLVESGFVTEEQMLLALERQSGIPWVRLRMSDIDATLSESISIDLVKMYKFMPVKIDDQILTIAISNPLSYEMIDDLRLAVQKEINPILVTEDVLENSVEEFYKVPKDDFWQAFGLAEPDEPIESVDPLELEEESVSVVVEEAEEVEESLANESVLSKQGVLEMLLSHSQSFAVSDIYIESTENGVRLRYRRDGVVFSYDDAELLENAQCILDKVLDLIEMPLRDEVMRTKIWDVDIDGNIVDVRGSVCASQYGYDVHLKRIHSYQVYQSLSQLGMNEDSRTSIGEFLLRKKGLMWVLGDANSGVSTTLRVLMDQADIAHKKIVSFETFIEENVAGVNQYEISPRDTLSIRNAWQDMLQIHPDMIVIDSLHLTTLKELVVEAIVTGCLVVIGMNVKSFEHALLRLEGLGVARDFLIYETDCVLEQVLVRGNCPRCIDVDENPIALNQEIAGVHYKSIGCDACHQTGYQGRYAIFQAANFDERMRQSLLNRHSAQSLQQLLAHQGSETLFNEGVRLLQERMTTREELNRLGLA